MVAYDLSIFIDAEVLLVISYGTTAMAPVRNCLSVMPSRTCGPEIRYATSRFLRATAVLMNFVAVRCTSGSSLTVFGGFGVGYVTPQPVTAFGLPLLPTET